VRIVEWIGRSLAAWLLARRGRKVRAPQGRVVGNADRSQDQGKCNRKQTATLFATPLAAKRGNLVRVKRCGKSAPAGVVTCLAR